MNKLSVKAGLATASAVALCAAISVPAGASVTDSVPAQPDQRAATKLSKYLPGKHPNGVNVKRGGRPEIKSAQLKLKQRKLGFDVSYRRALLGAVPKKASERGRVKVTVYRKISPAGAPRKVVQRFKAGDRLDQRRQTEHYSFKLSGKARQALKRASQADRDRLVVIQSTHGVDSQGDKVAEHRKISTANLRAARAPQAKGQGSAITLINGTDGPVQVVAQPVMCMYDYGNDNSSIAVFNAQQGAALQPGHSIEHYIEANANWLSSASYQGVSPGQFENTLESLGIDAAAIIAGKINPVVGPIIGHSSNCGTNLSVFQFSAFDSEGNYSNQAWGLTSNTGPFPSPLTDLQSAAGYQAQSDLWGMVTEYVFQGFLGDDNPDPAMWTNQSPWIADGGLSFQFSGHWSYDVTITEGGVTNQP